MKKILLVIALGAIIASCGSIVNGSKQVMSIDSNIKGAEITVDGKVIGVTPFKGEVGRANDPTLVIKKEGYKTQTLTLVSKTSGWYWGNILIGGFTGSSTDSSTGGRWEYAPDNYFIDLQPEGKTAMNSEKSQKASQLRQFVLMNYDRLNKDIAQGQGEYLNSVYKIYASTDQSKNKEILSFLKEIQADSKTMMEFAERMVAKI